MGLLYAIIILLAPWALDELLGELERYDFALATDCGVCHPWLMFPS